MKKLSEISRKDLLYNGVYKITNISNGKIYIGSCSSKTFLYERLVHHRFDLLSNKHQNKYLQRSFNRYGVDSFYYEVIESVQPEFCIEREQYWIDTLKPHYNLCKIAGSSFGRVCDVKTRIKISRANKDFWYDKKNRDRMLISFSNRPKRSKKLKIKDDIHGHCKKVTDLNTGIVYNSVIELSNNLDITYTYLVAILNGKRKSKSIKVKYVE